MIDLALQIEQYLLDRGDWVSAEEICRAFNIRDRQLRADGKRRGLISRFAVSDSRRGFIHVRLLPTDQFLRSSHKLARHGVSELRTVKDWKAARQDQRIGLPIQAELFSGQIILPLKLK